MSLRTSVVASALLIVLAGCEGETTDAGSGASVPASTPSVAEMPSSSRPSPTPADRSTPTSTADPSPSSQTNGGGSQAVVVFFNRTGEGVAACTAVEGVERRIEQTEAVATAAMNALFAGPSDDEQERRFSSLFSEDTAGLLRSVHVEGETAYLDLSRAFLGINNVSTSCAARMTLSSIEATLTQFPTVEEVRYAVEGDPATFYEFMQIGCPSPRSGGDRCDPAPFQRG